MVTQTKIPRAAVRGTASGVLFMAFFGTAWAGIAAGGLQGWGLPWTSILAIFIGIMLFVAGIRIWVSARNFPDKLDTESLKHSKHIGRWFGIIFGMEFTMIAAAGAIFGSTGYFDYFFPAMALIVGAHFLPLAHLFQIKTYYTTGGLICLLAIVTMLFVPLKMTIHGHQITSSWVCVGLGSALILWITSILILRMGQKMIQSSQAS